MENVSALATAAASACEEGTAFQPDPSVIRWRMHFSSPPAVVYRALATAEGRRRYWAESPRSVTE